MSPSTSDEPDEKPPLQVTTPELVSRDHRRSWLDSATELINDHLRAFRAVPWLVGGAGLLLLLRNTAVWRRFRSVDDIPSRLFQHNAKISGVVTAATAQGSVEVWHVPGLRRLLRWGHRPPPSTPSTPSQLLKVSCGGVMVIEPTGGAQSWLQQSLQGKAVRLTLLSRSGDTAQCIVHTKGVRRVCVNEQLLLRGLARQVEVTGFKLEHNWASFVTLLGRAEGVAKRKGAGLWKGSGHETLWRKFRNTIKKR